KGVHVGIHCFRHGVTSELLGSGTPIHVVTRLMRHADSKSRWNTTRASLAMPSGLRLRSSLSASGRTSLNWSQLPQLRPRKERTWRKRVGVEPTPESAKDTGYGFEDHEDHRAPFASASSIEEVSARAQGGPSQTLKRAARRARKRGWCE